MNEEDIVKRGEMYKRLIDLPEFQYFLDELIETSKELATVVLTDVENARIYEKGERAGILRAVTLPEDAINEMIQYIDE